MVTIPYEGLPRREHAMVGIQSGQEYLAEHPLTRVLSKLGLTNEQLSMIRFSPNNDGLPFDLWPIRCPSDIPDPAMSLLKPYCALRLLILDDHVLSGHKENAWQLVADALSSPIFIRERQRTIAQMPRIIVTQDGKTMCEFVTEFALKPEHENQPAKRVWELFFEELDRLGMLTSETKKQHPFDEYEYYDMKGNKRPIRFKYFSTLLSEARNQKST
jgi:hypothetical protein